MQHLPLSLAAPDMILAQDVRRHDTPTAPPICGKGVLLTESLIERLRNMGVQSVYVEGHPIWLEGDKTLDEELAIVDHRFRKVEDDPLMMKLKDILKGLLRKSMGAQDGQ